MSGKLTRRTFMVKSAVVLGTAAACELTGGFGLGNGAAVEALAANRKSEEAMPHISVKLFPGRSEETKKRLADAIARDVVAITGCDAASVSVSIEDVPSGEWKEKVYEPDIQGKKELLYKKPDYSM